MLALPLPVPHSPSGYARKAAMVAALLPPADNEDTRRELTNRVAYYRAVAAGQVRP